MERMELHQVEEKTSRILRSICLTDGPHKLSIIPRTLRDASIRRWGLAKSSLSPHHLTGSRPRPPRAEGGSDLALQGPLLLPFGYVTLFSLLYDFILHVRLLLLRQGFTVSFRLALNLLDGPSWPWTHWDLPASPSCVLGWQVCATWLVVEIL